MNLNKGANEVAGGPRVSVGMPVYNGGKFIGQAIRSILDQSFSDVELIICDNASDDATARICQQIATSDKRVQFHANPVNIGATDNYNKTFEYARGEYFKWASANDYCAKDLIERCVEMLDRRPDAVLCYPKTRLFETEISDAKDYEDNLDLQQTDPVLRFELLINRVRLNNAMNGVIRTNVLRKTKLHKGFWSSDWNLLAELVLRGKFIEIPDRLFYRRISSEAHSSKLGEAEILQRFWPNDKNALKFRTWKLHREYFADVFRAPLSFAEKCRLSLVLMKRLRWRRKMLVREFLSVFRGRDGKFPEVF